MIERQSERVKRTAEGAEEAIRLEGKSRTAKLGKRRPDTRQFPEACPVQFDPLLRRVQLVEQSPKANRAIDEPMYTKGRY